MLWGAAFRAWRRPTGCAAQWVPTPPSPFSTRLTGSADIYDVVVTGTPNERWGEQVTAVVTLASGSQASEEQLLETAAGLLSRYKLPKAFVFVDALTRAPSGKPDYRWAKETARKALGVAN